MAGKRRVVIKFADRKIFGSFCVKLSKEEVPFTLAGAHTVVMATKDYEALMSQTRDLAGKANVQPLVRGDKRPSLPTPPEVEALLWKYAKSR